MNPYFLCQLNQGQGLDIVDALLDKFFLSFQDVFGHFVYRLIPLVQTAQKPKRLFQSVL